MGTPLIVDSFHKDRWDYFYQLRQGGKVVEQRRVILDFEKELLARVRGDVIPATATGANTGEVTLSKPEAEAAKPAPAKKPEKGLWDKMKFWEKDEAKPQDAKPVETKPVEAKPAEAEIKPEQVKPEQAPTAAPAEPEASTTTEETPSVLAVPIPIGPAGDAPATIELPKTEAPQVEAAPAQMPQGEPSKPEPVVAPAPEPAKTESPKVEPEPVPEPVSVPEKIEPVRSRPTPTNNSKQDEKLIFRMDRTLDPKVLEEEMAPKPTPAPATEKPVEPKKKVDEAPLPPETEPGYFERMLEKIGF